MTRSVLVCLDGFRGAASSTAASAAVARGFERAGWRATVQPVSDGGEGLLDALQTARHRRRSTRVRGPRPGSKVQAEWLTAPGVAIIESAQAAGVELIPPAARDPRQTTSEGVGDLVRAAVDGGARRILLGLGGSGTIDGGAGMLRALGVVLRDAQGRALDRTDALSDVAVAEVPPWDVELIALCDVDCPATGPGGAVRVFGPQKGLRQGDVPPVELGLERLFAALSAATGRPLPARFAGAAGALSAGCALALGARLVDGAGYVLEQLDLPRRAAAHSLVATGEGKLDAQSLLGKLPVRVAALAPGRTVAFVGQRDVAQTPFAAVVALHPPGIDFAAVAPRTCTELEAAAFAFATSEAGEGPDAATLG